MENKKRRLETEEKSVPEDLVLDILSRSPAKDLVRFTCVSKSGRSLISTDPCFHRLQAQRTAPSDRQKPFLRIDATVWMNSYGLFNNYWVGLDSIEGYSREINNLFDLESIEGHSINNPFDGDDRDNQVLGSCHGLLLHRQQHTMKLKKHLMLPSSPSGDADAVFCGFGYDRVHDCYKVVMKAKQLFELKVYDLNKGAWKSLRFGAWWREQCRDWYLNTQDDWNDYSVKYVDGGVYRCVIDPRTQREIMTIVCFLLAEEEFHVVEPPDLGEVMYYPNLTVLEERLCLVCQSLRQMTEVWSNTDVDYDEQWWWTKLLAISDPHVKLSNDWSYLIPVCFSASGNEVLICVDYEQLFWYDLEKEEFRKLSDLITYLRVHPSLCLEDGGFGFFVEEHAWMKLN